MTEIGRTFVPEDYYEIKGVDRRLVDSCHIPSSLFCDVGGAGGIDALRLVENGSSGVCLDIGLNKLKHGKQRSRMLGLDGKVEFMAASATHLPFEKNTFELVTSFSVIDHLSNKRDAIQAIKEFSRVARINSFVVVTVPNKLFVLGTLMMRLQKGFFEQRFTPKELATYFKDAGLTVFRCDSQYPTKVGSTILKYNLPKIVQKVPASLLQGMFNAGSRLFKFVENHLPFALLGARFGFAALKITSPNV